jgi:tetratricopeptide (TPR) repeat protein
LFADLPFPEQVVIPVAAGLALLILLFLWRAFGRGPRRRRAYQQAQHLLRGQNWRAALPLLRDLRSRRPSAAWERRLRQTEAECHQAAATELLLAKDYEQALEHLQQAAQLLGRNPTETVASVVDLMLTEVRRLFATSPDIAPVEELLERLRTVQPAAPEAVFWQALCQVRADRLEDAEATLRRLVGGADVAALDRPVIDPSLYLGALLLRRGEAREALRVLTEANRIDGNCPMVIAQMGVALLESGGDLGFAQRTLQRALGVRGFEQWKREPTRAWAEGLPEGSYVRRLAASHPYRCPLWGSDVQPLLRMSRTALAEAFYRQGNYAEAVEHFNQLLQESAPSLPVIRGLGLSLARLERFDTAFKHLRAAHDLAPDDRDIAGYLALCGALGKPSRPEDKANNIAWAIWLVSKHDGRGDKEWARIVNIIFAEGRAHGVRMAPQDILRLCDTLASVDCTDRTAAEAYHALQAAAPEAVRPEYAWLYGRAAAQHGQRGPHSLALFARAFQDEPAARAFFTEHEWDFEALELAYLQCAAEQAPGQFPEPLGPGYTKRGEDLLLQRVLRLQQTNQPDAALATAEVLFKLTSASPRAHDCLAHVHFWLGDSVQAMEILQKWSALEPANPVPLVRQAVLHHRSGDHTQCRERLAQALQATTGRRRARIAYLGARLALAAFLAAPAPDNDPSRGAEVLELLEECLRAAPDHTEALWCRAAVHALLGHDEKLAELAATMQPAAVADPRYDYLAALCHLHAGNDQGVLEASQRASADKALAGDSAYLLGWAQLRRGDAARAAASFQQAAEHEGCLAAPQARALLGRIRFQAGAFEEAARWWQQIDPRQRTAWKLDQPLAATVYLSALLDLQAGRFEQAPDRLREAGKLGLRERQLGPRLTLALFKAGQQIFNHAAAQRNGAPDGSAAARWEEAARLLEQALSAGASDPQVAYLLALCHKRQGKTNEARAALRKIAQPDANVLLQLGLLSFNERQYAQADEELTRALALEPASYVIGYDVLLARLLQGKLNDCLAMIPELLPLRPEGEERQLLVLLGLLLERGVAAGDGAAVGPRPVVSTNGEGETPKLEEMSAAQEQCQLQMVRDLGQLEAVAPLLEVLARARPHSPPIQAAFVEVALLQAKRLADRCQWASVGKLLQPLVRWVEASAAPLPRANQLALFNLLGCCASMAQDFDDAVRYFTRALKLAGNDAWLNQNLALAYEYSGRFDRADASWTRYFELLDARVPAPRILNYHDQLAFEGLSRLADLYTRKELWQQALPLLQRAQRLRPNDGDTMERLFHLFQQVKRPEDARRVLRQLRELRPNEPQLELYELDMREARSLEDLERKLADIKKILTQYPNDMRVEERAVAMVGSVLPQIGRLSDQYADRLARIVEQVRRLPNYQINWPIVHDEMRRLNREFQKLRRIAHKCMPLVTQEEQRRTIKELSAVIDSKIQVCESLGG